ncbi:glutathione S-transferase [Actibacterium mucosum KCTC 23349]|uniref:Glutathione S-transferase n=1 Tax=Actibacterium mucosum KCTC 23349 TaxID=1454373 RepID=A0A037ZH51_9RHOB|nr:glutathione S-transferase N-terminal domain-containing protein [Actibacterium mucosum]KAJ54862.1 glutathione S-transferase [Actibacterium mucosum KCTC 23349]
MTKLSDFSISSRWPAQNPDILQLYSLATPNGVKVSIMLEEVGLPYEVHKISFAEKDQFTPEFLEISPNNKIPAIIDPNGPDGNAVSIFESAAILIYLAEKTGKFLPTGAQTRQATMSWLMFQMGSEGPMFGQLGYFHKFAGSEIEDPRPKQRYIDEGKRILGVMDRQLADKEWITGADYTIADIALIPWIQTLTRFYKTDELLELESFSNVIRWRDTFAVRPAVEKGWLVPA